MLDAKSRKRHDEARQRLGMSSTDRPYTSQRPSGWGHNLNDREIESLDIAYKIAMSEGEEIKHCVLDVHTNIGFGNLRTDNSLATLRCNSRPFSFLTHDLVDPMVYHTWSIESIFMHGLHHNPTRAPHPSM